MDSAESDLRLTDRDAFSRVFDRFFAPLARYARRITGDDASACDVVQDVFLKLWENRTSITVDVSLKAMLYTMVRNRSLNAIRRSERIARNVTPEDVAPAIDGSESDLQRLLYRWIDDLPDRRREAFTLSRFHDLSHAEIAKIMGLSERTVDTHIQLALRSLRERMDRTQH